MYFFRRLFNTRVFISYRRDSGQTLAQLLYKQMNRHGYQMILDTESLPSGSLPVALKEKINSSRDFLLLLTKNSLQSYWVQKEIEYALELGKNIVPVVKSDEFDVKNALRNDVLPIPLHPLTAYIRSYYSGKDHKSSLKTIFKALESSRIPGQTDKIISFILTFAVIPFAFVYSILWLILHEPREEPKSTWVRPIILFRYLPANLPPGIPVSSDPRKANVKRLFEYFESKGGIIMIDDDSRDSILAKLQREQVKGISAYQDKYQSLYLMEKLTPEKRIGTYCYSLTLETPSTEKKNIAETKVLWQQTITDLDQIHIPHQIHIQEVQEFLGTNSTIRGVTFVDKKGNLRINFGYVNGFHTGMILNFYEIIQGSESNLDNPPLKMVRIAKAFPKDILEFSSEFVKVIALKPLKEGMLVEATLN